MNTALIGIDWGTSQLRAYRIGPQGEVLERREGDLGIATIRNGGFDTALESFIDGWQPDASNKTPIVMCGMIGSRQGWREVPYCPCPARIHDLAKTLTAIDTRGGPALMVGGLSTTESRGIHDVMRGEETQIFGVAPPTGRRLIVTPGTHSKWALIQDAAIESFRTYMTGEIYAVLSKHSILGWASQDKQESIIDETSFLEGVREALEDPDLLHSLFSVRTRGLFEQKPPAALASYLSGILIGSEVSGAVRYHSKDGVTVIASPTLGRLYQAALAAIGYSDIQWIDANQAVVQGLWRLWQLRGTKS